MKLLDDLIVATAKGAIRGAFAVGTLLAYAQFIALATGLITFLAVIALMVIKF